MPVVIRADARDVPVVLTSGDAADAGRLAALLPFPVLTKPFAAADVLDLVRGALAAHYGGGAGSGRAS